MYNIHCLLRYTHLHLDAGARVAALLIKPDVLFITVQNDLVAAQRAAQGAQMVDQHFTQLLAPVLRVHGDVLNVANEPARMDQLLLHQHGAHSGNAAALRLNDHAGVEAARTVIAAGKQKGVPVRHDLIELRLCEVAHGGEAGEGGYDTGVVAGLDAADLKSRRGASGTGHCQLVVVVFVWGLGVLPLRLGKATLPCLLYSYGAR